jgi:hypothetical protein
MDIPRTARYGKWYAAAAAVLLVILLITGRDVLYPVRALWWHAEALVWWLVILAGAVGQGALLYKFAGGARTEISPGLAVPVAAGLGLGLFSLQVLLLGAFGLMSTPVLTALVLLVLAVSLTAGRGTLALMFSSAAHDLSRRGRDTALPLTAVFATAVTVFPLVLLPTRAFDALSYHLEVPLRYLQAGAVVNIPENTYSYSPLLTQMLYGLGMGLEGPDLAGLIYFTFFTLTLWTLWKGGEKIFSSAGSAWAAAFVALTPVFLVEVPQAGADWSMAFYTTTALLLAGSGRNMRLMVLAGLLAGMAAGCRHQGLGFALVLIPAAGLLTDLPKRRPGSFTSWSAFAAAAVLSASPWYIKNLVQTGDPLYPLFTSMAGGLPYKVGFVEGLTGPRSLDLAWSWILVPFKAAFYPLSLSMTATVGVLPLALVLLLPGLKGRRAGSRFLLLWVVMAFFAWHLTFRTFRYLMPVVAVGYLWLGTALAAFLENSGVRERILKYAVCIALVVNGGTFLGLSDYVNKSVAPALGISSPLQYIRETYDTYPAIEYLNSLDPPPGRVLFVGEMRGFYSEFPREVASHNAPNRLLEMVKEGWGPDKIKDSLTAAGFTHILFNPVEWERMAYLNRNAPLWEVDDRGKRAVLAFLRDHTRLLFGSRGISVYGITGE